jgi:hypothetical protein
MNPDRSQLVVHHLPLDRIDPHALNPNVMPADYFAKLKLQLKNGRCPPLIVRAKGDRFECLDGEHRGRALRENGFATAPCCIWDMDDHEALIALATLNRLEGSDVPGRRAALIAALASQTALEDLAAVLPEDAGALHDLQAAHAGDLDALLAELTVTAAQERAASDQLFSFLVPADAVPTVEAALATAERAVPPGPNRRGRALAALCRAAEGGGR